VNVDPLERIQAEYRYAVLQLQRIFREEKKAFFEAFKDEIVAAYAGRKISPVIREAAERLQKSQDARLKRAHQNAVAEVLLLQQEYKKFTEQVEVN
jgi:hypothetical protein